MESTRFLIDYKNYSGRLTSEKSANQAAHILDVVASIAAYNRDTETLIATAKLWMNMVEVSQHLMITPEDEKTHKIVGFTRKEDEPHGRTDPTPPDED